MRIDSFNGHIINSEKIYVHDDILKQLHFDCYKSELVLVILTENDKQNEYFIKFRNILGFKMTSCDFWGRSPHILDFEYVVHEGRAMLPELDKIKESIPVNPLCKLLTKTEYLECVLTLTSGDKLTVVCEYIDYEKT